jgi:hypothetical protein
MEETGYIYHCIEPADCCTSSPPLNIKLIPSLCICWYEGRRLQLYLQLYYFVISFLWAHPNYYCVINVVWYIFTCIIRMPTSYIHVFTDSHSLARSTYTEGQILYHGHPIFISSSADPACYVWHMSLPAAGDPVIAAHKVWYGELLYHFLPHMCIVCVLNLVMMKPDLHSRCLFLFGLLGT